MDDDGDGLIDEDSQGREPNDPGYTNDLVGDDDENGFSDDIRGWDFGADDNDLMDTFRHGTFVAGCAGAVGNNELGITGVCWNVKLMAVNIANSENLSWSVFASNAIKGIDYAIENGATVINASWGAPEYIQALSDAVQRTEDAGVIFCAAAGNFSVENAYYPARYGFDNIISVMATDHRDTKWFDSNFHLTNVDLAAPGVDILSCQNGGGYTFDSGTSYSCPLVAGACALVWTEHPEWNYLQVKEAILGSVDPVWGLRNQCVTGGRLNLYNAVVYEPPALSLSLADDVADVDPNDPNSSADCVLPDDLITYTICFSNPITDPNDPNYLGNQSNVVLTDFLPLETEFVSADPNSGIYATFDSTGMQHHYTWDIATLNVGDPEACYTITVKVYPMAEPLGSIINRAEMELESTVTPTRTTETTPVCCWGGDIIYVDDDVLGNTGVAWEDAYPDLQSALDRAAQGCGNEIWVAGGTYVPSEPNGFSLIDGVKIYGGFSGNEDPNAFDLDSRDFLLNKTYLSAIDNFTNVVSADSLASVNDTVLDGFALRDATGAGIDLNNAGNKLSLKNLVILENISDGIKAVNSEPIIDNCLIQDNGGDGMNFSGSGKNPTITHSIIRNNKDNGVQSVSSYPTILNSWLHGNGTDGTGSGLLVSNPSSTPVIRNSTIVANADYGITASGLNAPDVINSILWGNQTQLDGATASYSLIQDPDDPNGVDAGCGTPDGNNNITCNPEFAYSDPNFYDFHLSNTSPGIDAGDSTAVAPGETDIDRNNRIIGTDPDMGADEQSCSDVFNAVDFVVDTLVNYREFSVCAAHWLTDPNDPNWLPACDLDSDSDTDLDDLVILAGEWVWQPCWFTNDTWLMMPTTWPLDSDASITQHFAMQAAKEARWLEITPTYERTLLEEIVYSENIIAWLEDVATTPGFMEEIDEDNWVVFMITLNELLEELILQYEN